MQRHMMLAGLQLDCSNLEYCGPAPGNAQRKYYGVGIAGALRGCLRGGKPASEEACDALFQHYHLVLDAGLQRFALQQLEGFFYGLVRQAKCSVMHGDHPAGIQIEKGASGVGGTGVDIAKLRRIVGADGEQREFGRQAASDFAEAGEVRGVSSVVDGVFSAAQHVAAIAAVRILEDARAPVPRRDVSDVERAVAISIPPLKFDNLFKSEIGNQVE